MLEWTIIEKGTLYNTVYAVLARRPHPNCSFGATSESPKMLYDILLEELPG